MSTLQTIRYWQKRSVLRTSLVLIAVWLNVAFQTCVMASMMPVEDCPHCPTGMHDAGEMPSVPMDCGLLESIDDPDLAKPVVKVSGASGDHGFIASIAWIEPVESSAEAVKVLPIEPSLPFHGPPPNVLFCVDLN
jgi:hypothetical protein